MSFSSQVKRELAEHLGPCREDWLAELAALLETNGQIRLTPPAIRVQSENEAVVKKVFTLLEKAFNIEMEIRFRKSRDGARAKSREGIIEEPAQVQEVLTTVGFWRQERDVYRYTAETPLDFIQSVDGRRAFVRGAFLGCGSITDPEKNYHIEFIGETESFVMRLQQVLGTFGVESHILERKRPSARTTYVLYLKDGSQIVDVLNIMEAHVALMELENVRILKEMRNQVNRQVNCETANLNKTIGAAVKQIEDIRFLQEERMLDTLPDSLKEMAQVRLENEDVSLKDLGLLLDPPIGKSGVNHRLRKLSQIADELRIKKDREAR